MTTESIATAVLFLTVYFVPFMIARGRNHHQRSAIAVLNLLLGWTLLGLDYRSGLGLFSYPH